MMELEVHLHERLLHVLDMRGRAFGKPLPLPEIGPQRGDLGLGKLPRRRPSECNFRNQPASLTSVFRSGKFLA